MNYKICILSIVLSFTAIINTCFSQDSNYLSKKLDSLKSEQSRMLSDLDRINSDIAKVENQITALTLKNNSILGFKKVSVLTKNEMPFRKTPVLNGSASDFIPKGSSIEVIDYENDFLKVIFNKKIGYVSSLQFANYDEVKSQVDSLYERDRVIQLQKEDAAIKNKQDEINKKYEKLRALGVPIELSKANVSYNSIGNPEAILEVRNISNKIIDAFEVDILCYDNYNRPVSHYLYKTNRFKGISQDEIEPFDENYSTWTLHGHENTTKIKINIKSVHFKNGTKWLPKTNIGISGE
ncbi:hypothetical protein EMA8858_04168 [Emticicia aquatica]|uniref:SH3 domain-containing protein n=1 Tax=Emticicia aquatica TaxID=1681835 RepID=A0ABM9AVG4_9BACT|nr:hypothetical protein [Emticicia aquatica]CAH0998033.1 hypothetical protein EMA8858_04168 [Emticicia aquatica]